MNVFLPIILLLLHDSVWWNSCAMFTAMQCISECHLVNKNLLFLIIMYMVPSVYFTIILYTNQSISIQDQLIATVKIWPHYFVYLSDFPCIITKDWSLIPKSKHTDNKVYC